MTTLKATETRKPENMALFTDPNVVTLDDLIQFEASLVQVSTTHSIDVSTKINLAVSAISDKLMLWLLDSGASDPQFLQRRNLGLSTVVVTPTLYRWVCFDSLSRFFAEAYNVQLNTRFQQKWTEYQQQSQQAADMVFMSGIGVVNNPLPRPAMPLLTVVPGSSAAGSLFVETTWVDSKGNESAPSEANGHLLPELSSLTVTPSAGYANIPPAAVGWNIYASTTDADFTAQNAAPLPLNQTWQLPAAGLASGGAPSGGQHPDFYIALTRRMLRG
jgi:hypothetical protein